MRLTDLAIRKLKLPKKGQKIYYDDALRGFGVRISQKTKAFVVTYGTDRKRVTLGKFPETTLSEARTTARKLLINQTQHRVAIAFPEAREDFLIDNAAKNRAATVYSYALYLNAFEYAGKVEDITRRVIKDHLSTYATSSSYSHALVAFKVFFNWAIRHELIDKHPLSGEKGQPTQSRNRVLTPDELKRLWQYAHPNYSDVVKLLILTGQRRNEIARLNSEWIQNDTITLPAHITKNKREHIFPFGNLTARYLSGEGLLFKNAKGTPLNGWSKSKVRIDKHTGLSNWTIHDLRRTFATIHAQLGTPIHITEKLLNHVSGSHGGIVGVYQQHAYMTEMKKAVETYEAHIATIVSA